MGNFTEFYENFFKESPKEKEINDKINKLIEDYESSDAFIEYNAKMDALIDELRVERTNKRAKNPIKRGQKTIKIDRIALEKILRLVVSENANT